MKRILFAPDPIGGGGGAPAAPVAAPAPAPSPAPTAAPAPSKSPEPAPAAGGGGDNPFAELDRAFEAGGTKMPAGDKPADVKEAAKPEPAAKPAVATPAKPADKPAAPVLEGPKQLRERKDALERELTESKTANAELVRKVAEYEAKGRDTTGLLSQLDAERKEKEGILAELRMLKNEASPEFKAKYDEPFNRAATFAQNVVVGLDKSDGQPATWDDFAGIYGLANKSLNRAIAEARTMFGDNSGVVIQQLTKLHELNFERGQAMESERKNWQERTKSDEAKAAETKVREQQQHQQRVEEFKGLWKKVNDDLEATVPSYAVPTDDKELNAAKAKGLAIVDVEEKDFKKALPRNAHIRQRAAMFAVNQIQIARLTAENARLKTELDGKNPPPPGGGKRPGGHENTAPAESWEEGAMKAIRG